MHDDGFQKSGDARKFVAELSRVAPLICVAFLVLVLGGLFRCPAESRSGAA
jgi:hypothetical protein